MYYTYDFETQTNLSQKQLPIEVDYFIDGAVFNMNFSIDTYMSAIVLILTGIWVCCTDINSYFTLSLF